MRAVGIPRSYEFVLVPRYALYSYSCTSYLFEYYRYYIHVLVLDLTIYRPPVFEDAARERRRARARHING